MPQINDQALYRRILCCSTMTQREGETYLYKKVTPSPVTSDHTYFQWYYNSLQVIARLRKH